MTSLNRPPFPSYIFIELDLKKTGWRSVDGTYRVRRIVKQNDRPAPCPKDCIDMLMSPTKLANLELCVPVDNYFC